MSWLFGEPLSRLLWKEWRIAKSFAIALAVFGAALLLLSQAMGFSNVSGMSSHNRANLIVPMIPLMAIVGILATGFAAERENNTLAFHRSLPTTVWQTMFSKLFVGLLVAMALFLWMATIANVMDGSTIGGRALTSNLLPLCELVVWGTWISLLTRRPLVALVVACLLAIGAAFLSSWVLGNGSASILARWGTVLVVGSAALISASSWFDDRSGERLGQLGWVPSSSALASRSDHTRQGWFSQLARLAWCQIKADFWLWVAMLALLAVSIMLVQQHGIGVEVGILLHVVLFALIGGIASAKTDTEKRFLSSQALSPTFVWLSNLTIPITLALTVMVVNLTLIQWRVIRSDFTVMLLTGAMTSAVVGHWMARSARSKVTAFGTSIATGVFVVMWLGMATVLQVPWWYSAFPAILGGLLATWITCRAWLYGWQDRGAKGVAIGTFLVVAVVVFGAFGWYRATEFPANSIAQDSPLLELPETDDQKASQFRKIASAIRNRMEQPSSISVSNAELAERIAGNLENSMLAFPVHDFTHWEFQSLHQMHFELLRGVYDVVQEGDSVRAKRFIRAHFQLSKLMDESGVALRSGGQFAPGFSASAIRWAWMPEVTAEDIREMIDVAESTMLTSETIRRSIAVQADMQRRLVRGDWSVLGDPEHLDEWAAGEAFNIQLSRILPWERIRLNRFLDAETSSALHRLERYEETLQNQRRPDLEPQGRYLPQFLNSPRLLVTDYRFRLPRERTFFKAIRVRRAQIVCLALVLYHKTHEQKLPDDIRDLVGIVKEETLIDPVQGQPFILVNPSALTEWVAEQEKLETYDWRNDPLQVYRGPFLWSPTFVVERDTESSSEDPRFWITRNRTGTTYPINMLLDEEPIRRLEYIMGLNTLVLAVLQPDE